MTPSERVLESWREHARDYFQWECLKNYKQRVILGASQETANGFGEVLRTDEMPGESFASVFCADVRRFPENWSSW